MSKKTFFIIFLVFAWILPAKSQLDLNALEKERMANARVRIQTEWAHEYVSGRPAARGVKQSVTEFDRRGNKVKITNFDKDGVTIISVVVYQYDSRDNRVNYERRDGGGRMLQSQRTVYDSRGNITREYGAGNDGKHEYNNTFTYDAIGRLTEIVYTTENAVTERRQFSYSGNRTEVSVFDARNNLLFRLMNTHNDRGLLLSEVRTNIQGNVQHSMNMQYNSAGNLTEELRRRGDNKLEFQKTYQYDRNNRPTKIETTNLGGTKFVSNEYQYNSNGDLIFESWRRNERVEQSTNKFTYDARGIYTEKDSYFASFQLRSLYKYEYEMF